MTADFVPLYSKIVDTIRARLTSGVYARNEALPTETDLRREFGVSRHTIRAALQCLVADGLIVRIPGRGTFSSGGTASKGEWIIRGIEDIIDVGLSGEYDVKSAKYLSSARQQRVAGILGVRPSSRLFNVQAVRSGLEGPFGFSNIFLPAEIGSRLPRDLFPSRPILLLVEEYCGIRVVQTRQVASTSLADRRSSALLDIDPGAPLLVLERTHYDRTGRAVQFSHVQYRSDRYQQVVYFYRKQGSAYANSYRRQRRQLSKGDGVDPDSI